MPISYTVISHLRRILVEHNTLSDGNHPTIARKIIQKFNSEQASTQKKSYSYEGQCFHLCTTEDGFVFMCMADAEMGHRLCFAFLQEIQNRFSSTYYQIEVSTAPEGTFLDFARVLVDQMNFFSNDANSDKIRRVNQEIDHVKNMMIENIDKVLERGDKIEILRDKTDLLEAQSTNFKKVSTAVKKKMWWHNKKVCCGMSIVLLIVIAGIVVLILFLSGVKIAV